MFNDLIHVLNDHFLISVELSIDCCEQGFILGLNIKCLTPCSFNISPIDIIPAIEPPLVLITVSIFLSSSYESIVFKALLTGIINFDLLPL